MYWQVASGQRPLTNGGGMIFWLQGWLASAPSEAQQGTRHLENCLFAINIVVITIHAILTIPRLQSICSLSLLPATTSQDLVRFSICQATKSWILNKIFEIIIIVFGIIMIITTHQQDVMILVSMSGGPVVAPPPLWNTNVWCPHGPPYETRLPNSHVSSLSLCCSASALICSAFLMLSFASALSVSV